MVLDAAESEAVGIDADDRRDDADPLVGRLEHAALLDMRLEVTAIAALLEMLTRLAFEAGRLERVAHRRAFVAMPRLVDLGVAEHPDERAAADHLAPMALLVSPRGDVDREMRGLWVLGERARDLQPVDHAHHAVEPAATRLGVGMRAEQDARAGLGTLAQHRANAVDHRLEPRLLHATGQPVPALDVLRRQVRAVHASLVAAEIGDAPQVREESFAVDPRHIRSPHPRLRRPRPFTLRPPA